VRNDALEAVIARIEEWRGREVSYAPVDGGITNANWRVHVAGAPHDYFVKLPGPGTEMFIDRHAAHDASLVAAESGYGAPVVCYLPDLGVEVMQFLEGVRSATNSDFQRVAVRRNAVTALRSFNRQRALNLTKTAFDMVDEHLADAERLRAHAPPDISWLRDNLELARAAVSASGIEVAPCMNDTLAANFMLDERDCVRLVDFEYAANNDVHYELAVWLGEMFYPPEVEHESLEQYFGRVSAQVDARVQVYKAIADLKWATWAMLQRRLSSADFDYHKYGMWKYLRARTVIGDPRWERWLRQL